MKTVLTFIAFFAMTTFCFYPYPDDYYPDYPGPVHHKPQRRHYEQCSNRPLLNMGHLKRCHFKYRISAIGFQYDDGAMWAAICERTPKGNVPCKVHRDGRAYYAWGGKEYQFHGHTRKIYGELISNKAEFPSNCKPKGYQTSDKSPYYNALVPSRHGLVPGKASADRKTAWYGWGWKEYCFRDNFYIIC